MKYVILSADSKPTVYLVPDVVCEQLRDYCMAFIRDLYRYAEETTFEVTDDKHTPLDIENIVCYDETAFIYWLNHVKFPNEVSTYVETLNWVAYADNLPPQYRASPSFNF